MSRAFSPPRFIQLFPGFHHGGDVGKYPVYARGLARLRIEIRKGPAALRPEPAGSGRQTHKHLKAGRTALKRGIGSLNQRAERVLTPSKIGLYIVTELGFVFLTGKAQCAVGGFIASLQRKSVCHLHLDDAHAGGLHQHVVLGKLLAEPCVQLYNFPLLFCIISLGAGALDFIHIDSSLRERSEKSWRGGKTNGFLSLRHDGETALQGRRKNPGERCGDCGIFILILARCPLKYKGGNP
jgi:hypothetical protein